MLFRSPSSACVAERAATQALLGQISKPALDQIEPGTGRGSKVQLKARMATQPTRDTGMLVGGVVVHDQVQVQFARRLLVDALQEADEFLMETSATESSVESLHSCLLIAPPSAGEGGATVACPGTPQR